MSEPTYLAILVLAGVVTLGIVKAVEPLHDKPAAKVEACSMCGQPGRTGLIGTEKNSPTVAPTHKL